MSEGSATPPEPGVATLFEDLFERAPCGYVTLAEGERITRVNQTLAGWLNVDSQALAGRRLGDLLTLPCRIFFETQFAPALRLQSALEEVAVDLDLGQGDKLPVLMTARTVHGPDGRIFEIRVALLRARARRGYERELQEREAAALNRLDDEKATAELREQFIAVLGHDLRNPLASIAGATRLLKREATSDKSLKVLQLMEASVDRMAGLVDDVMDFARGRLGSGIAVEQKYADLEIVLRQVVSELEMHEPSRVFICEFALREPISFDEGRIAQLVSNLLGNALAHGDPRSPVRLLASTSEGRLSVAVCNGGPAIPPAAMDRLFQPFFRGEVRASRQGLGLGLHIASEIARAHGGSLTVSSDDEETCFTLVMPCDQGGPALEASYRLDS